MKARILGGITASIMMLMATAAFAGGPLILFGPDDAYRYPPGNVNVYTDLGGNGNMTGAESDAATAYGYAQWTGVATSYFAASIAGDFSAVGLPDITGANAGMVVGTFNGGGIHVMYDNDGTITMNYFGAPPGVLGIASPDFAATGTHNLLESWTVLNGTAADVGGALSFGGVFTHEFGHTLNLAHTQTNGAAGFFGDNVGPGACGVPFNQPQTISDFETMYPYLDPSIGSTGEYQRTVDHLDDIAAISDVYATNGWPNNTGTISGVVTDPSGTLELTGINVIARPVNNPYVGANSTLTGAWTQGDFGPDGRFTLNGLTPGEQYILYIDEIVSGGYSTPPASIPGDGSEEYWNASESADPGVDDPCDYTFIVPVAGVPSTNDIIVNGNPFDLNLGDDDYVQVSLPFTFTFCGTPWNSVYVGSNGFITFGQGDTDFSESVADLLNGPARICGVWDDLNPGAGGSITAMPDGSNFVITWTNVPEFPSTGGNTFSITLKPDNTFDVDYGALTLTDGMAGRSPGNGEPDPGPTDLSAAAQPIGAQAPTVYEQYVGTNDLAGLTLAYAPCVFPDPPYITVTPSSLSAMLLPDEMAVRTLKILNEGDLDLNFNIKTSQDNGSPAQGGVIVRRDLGIGGGSEIVSDPVTLARIDQDNAGTPPGKADVHSLQVPLPHVYALNLLSENFDAGFPAGWSVVDNVALGVTWMVPQQGEGNYTGGTGDAAGASSDFVGAADFDTELRTPPISGFGDNVVLTYVANYQNFAAFDFLDVDVSTDGGANWTNVLRWNQDHGTFRGTPGEQVSLDLDPYVQGAAEFIVRWRYYDPTTFDYDWYVQIDDVSIVSDEILTPCAFISDVSPNAGTIAGDDMAMVDVTFDATGFSPGTYDCELIIFSNAGNDPRLVVPLQLIVAQQAYLDIKPGSCPNPFQLKTFEWAEGGNAKKGGVLPVALAGSGDFDVADVDAATILLEGVPPLMMQYGPHIDDVATASVNDGCMCTAAGGDGYMDLDMKFDSQVIAEAITAGMAGDDLELTLTGQLTNGLYFMARDCIRFVGDGKDGGDPGTGTPTATSTALGFATPNPFNPTTTINFSLPAEGRVSIQVFDVSGRVVAELVNGVRSAGDHSITWNADGLASGIYFYRMVAGDFTQTRRMVLLK